MVVLTPALIAAACPEDTNNAKGLVLSGRMLTHIEDISHLVHLTRLDLSHNALGSGESLSGLQYCRSLTWLSVAHNKLRDISHLCKLSSLAVLNVSANELKVLPEALSACRSLKALIANDNQIRALATPLPPLLTALVLSKNLLEDIDAALRPLKGLEKLCLSHNRFHAVPDISKNERLVELRLNNNKIMRLPGSVRSKSATMRLVDLGNNALEKAEDLGWLRDTPSLEWLNVKGNPMADPEVLAGCFPRLRVFNSQSVEGKKRKRKV